MSGGARHGEYSVQNTATFTVSVNEQFKVGIVDAEQSSHLFIRPQMKKLQRAQDLTGLPHNLVVLDARTFKHTAKDTAMKRHSDEETQQ